MRTNIEIDDKLIAAVMALTGAKTKRQAVEEALQERLRRVKAAKAVIALRGKVKWKGDLGAMRRAG
jgi:Arc/MetJ family transcription regulator